MINIEHALEFDRIKEIWSEFAFTETAKKAIHNITICLSESEVIAKQRETTQAKIFIEKIGNPPMTSMNGISEILAIAKKGDCLTADQLETVEMSLAAVKRLREYLNRGKQYEISLAYYEENLDDLKEIRQAISLSMRNGRVEDCASKLLKEVRVDIDRTEDKMHEKANAVMRRNKEFMSDSFSTMRNGHVCIPVKKEYKFKISGSVIDQSATGNTVFIEPTEAAKQYEQLQYLKIEEENEERRILYSLTAQVADGAEKIEENVRTIEKLDFIFSKGKLSLSYSGTEPYINTDRHIMIKNGRYPLMDREICVPLQFELGNGVNGIIITGPNTGGKTVAIKTVALNCFMAQCGLHVACEEAKLCMNSNFLCDIGDGQNISENLSTFSAHIVNVLDILKQVNKNSFVIMDELGSGTDPTEGMGIAIAILEELKKSGALFLVTTHYPEVKVFAQKESNIVNARMTFDKNSLKPLYHLIIGEVGESCAFYIAQKLGMPDSMIKCAAKAAYGDVIPEQWKECYGNKDIIKQSSPHIKRKKQQKNGQSEARKFQLGDSVMVYPDKKIGIVCQTADEKGILRVQLPNKKIWINHKRVKLHVAVTELYPEDYDFSIIFDSVQNRKIRHKMQKRHIEETIVYTD